MRVVHGELQERRAQVSHSNSQRSWNERESAILLLRSGDAVGAGEAAPLPGYSRDDLATCTRELEGCWERLPEIDPAADVRATLRDVVSKAAVRSPAAVFALETAVLDLVAKASGRPAWALLRGADDAAPIPISALAEGIAPADVAAAAERAHARGIRVVKVKVGGPDHAARDRARLGAIRDRLGPRIGLRLDANQGLPIEGLSQTLAMLASFEPELLEEPTKPEHLEAIRESPIPLALDETLMLEGWEERIVHAARRGTHGAVVLKPMALGGFERCLAMAETAATVGLAAIVTHTFDGPIGSAAAACLALAIRGKVLPCGLDAHGRFDARTVRLAAIDDTHLRPFTVSGLGVSGFE